MGGGGAKYEASSREPPKPDELLLEVRKERIEQVIAQRTRSLTVVLDRLEDTFNMAAVLRTCEGLGLQDIHVVQNPAHPFRPHSKVTQGCDKWLDVHLHQSFGDARAALKARGYAIWASAIAEGGQSLYTLSFDKKVALVFGNERFGVSPEALAGCDGVFWIPMRGFSRSFNISVAVAASVSHAVHWRAEKLGEQGDLSAEEATELKARFYLLSVKQRERIYRGE